MLGAGAWGTALAIAFAGKHEVTLWSREEDVAVDLLKSRENHRFFPGHRLPDAVRVWRPISPLRLPLPNFWS